MNMDHQDAYDLRIFYGSDCTNQDSLPVARAIRDDVSVSTNTSSMTNGITIVSSAPPSSPQSNRTDRVAGDGTADISLATSLLSLNPSMIDSSVLVPAGTNTGEHWIGLHRSSRSQSSLSEMSTSTGASYATPCSAPDAFDNIGRSLILASIAASNASTCGSEENDANSARSEETPEPEHNPKRVQWWDQLHTDADWDNFRTKANGILEEMISEEMKNMESDEGRVGIEYSVDKTSLIAKGCPAQNQEVFFRARQWLQGLYEALTATDTSSSDNTSAKSKYVSTLVTEIIAIKREMGELPPVPPPLPQELNLHDLPAESRELLNQYRDNIDSLRQKALQEREGLTGRYAQCQERLLAIIIDTEEKLFWKSQDTVYSDECNILGAVNDDGYIEVLGKKSPVWHDVDDEKVRTSQSKCQMTLRAALFAALTAGAGFLLTFQSKRTTR
mmetsp:Transcript_5955/g.7741  ORF Transcript_5955/g.7741 Transcript_5955/m.7741 type:complete len:445 (+) Transcript_5955:78-1412(+)